MLEKVDTVIVGKYKFAKFVTSGRLEKSDDLGVVTN